jgi:hypothetical protein
MTLRNVDYYSERALNERELVKTTERQKARRIREALEEAWSNKGGHMLAMSGYVVPTPDAAEPYKVIFDHGDGPDTEQACRSLIECQALIRRTTAIPPYRGISRDQGAWAL